MAIDRGLGRARDAKSGCEPTDLREVINAILYQNKTGCPWDMLPHDLLPRSTVFGYYTKWQKDGTWERLLDTLRGEVRRATPRVVQTQEGEPTEPAQHSGTTVTRMETEVSAGGTLPPQSPVLTPREETSRFVIMDSQSVKTTEVGGKQRGYDGGKKVEGRKRHIAVDTLGLLVVVTAANLSDGRGACQLLEQMTAEKFPRLKVACGDGRYNDKRFIAALDKRKIRLEVKSVPPDRKGSCCRRSGGSWNGHLPGWGSVAD